MTTGDEIVSEVWNDLFMEQIADDLFSEEINDHDQDSKHPETYISTFPVVINESKAFDIELESYRSSTRDLVGLQLWRGAFLLAEYLLQYPDILQDQNALELAAGTGFTSLVAALFAKNVICTDIDNGSILSLIESNFLRNSGNHRANVKVAEIDFFKSDWQTKLCNGLEHVNVVLVADVVYNAEITRAFFKALHYLLTKTETLNIMITLEKRLWTDKNGSIVAPSYDEFLLQLHDLRKTWQNHVEIAQLDIDFPHVFSHFYNRNDNLVLWQIKKLK